MPFEVQEEFVRIVEYMPISVLILQNGSWVYINQTAIQLIGASSKEQLIGTSIPVLNEGLHAELNRCSLEIERNFDEPILNAVEATMIRLDGITLEVEVTAIEAAYKGETAFVLSVTDLTELKRGRELLQQSEILTVVGEMAAGIAHEIRNPLTSLRGFIQLAQRDQANKQEYFSIILSELDRIHMIVNELLLLARPRELSFSEECLKELLQSVTTLVSTQAILHNVQIQVDYRIASDLLPIECDGIKLKQVFINIIKNGIEAMVLGGGLFLIQVENQGDEYLLKFIDQGGGISPERMSRIGQSFFSTKEEGTGLGLKISQSIVETHGGQMRIYTKPGQGTTVQLKLPKRLSNNH